MMKSVRHGISSRIVLTIALVASFGCQRQGSASFEVSSTDASVQTDAHDHDHEEGFVDDLEIDWIVSNSLGSCTKANAQQLAEVNAGNEKAAAFLKRCQDETGVSPLCEQLMRPNPDSKSSFFCTYSPQQPHQLIHPDETTWANAITAVTLIQDLHAMGIEIESIYNWWRPEPYNANVGGAAGRHPFGTSIDVRFLTKKDQERAHAELCKMRKAGRLRALGYYNSTALHLGVGDHTPNTWGKTCP